MNSEPIAAWIWNGEAFVDCDSVPLGDRGFRYGMSVFESLPVRNRSPFFLHSHYERLQIACAQTGFISELPPLEAFDTLLRGIAFDGFARIYVTAGDGEVSAHARNGRVIVFAEPRSPREIYALEAYKLAQHSAPHAPLLGGLKTANYWANLIALQKARQRECDESLLFNAAGELVSACMANVFVVQNGKIKTPATSTGARSGVIREWVMRKRPVGQGRITENDLYSADEIFLTSSWLGVMPVLSLEGRQLPSREAASQLRVEYEREISEIPGGE